MKVTKKSAFSLVELSIVILVIGIVLAGITQSSRLIRQFQLSSARTKTESSAVSSIPDLVAWFDMTTEISTANAEGKTELEEEDGVETWKTIQKNTSQISLLSTATNNPIYLELGINGLPSVEFDKNEDDQRMSTNFVGYNMEFTVFMVIEKISNNALSNDIFSIRDANSPGSLFFNINSSGTVAVGVYDGVENDGYITSDSALANNDPTLLTYVYNPNSGDARFYIDQTRQDSSTDTTAPTQTLVSTNIYLGGHPVADDRVFDGLVGEIIIYNRGLKTEERLAVENYLVDKWGL